MTVTTMPLLKKLILIGFGLFILVVGPQVLSIFANVPVWMSNVFYFAALVLVIYGIYLAVRNSRERPTT